MPNELHPDSHASPGAAATRAAGERLSADELAQFRQQLAELDLDVPPVDSLSDIAPESIGRFEIQERIGSGSFGSVYLAFDPKLTRSVAIKVAHIGTHSSKKLRARFIREAHAAARLAHPNIVSLHEYGEEGGLLYLVYEMCDGPTLENWMADRPDRTPPHEAVAIVRQLASGLAHAHSRGLVHRDVKPGNILLQPSDQPTSGVAFTPRITDFGLAHDLLAREDRSYTEGLFGTIDYMSPEQAQGETNIQPAADLYSLGIILYRMLTGMLPFRNDNIVDALQAICRQPAPPLRKLNPAIPKDLEAICLKCLEKKPGKRYESCEELVRELDRFTYRRIVRARPLSPVERGLRAVMAAPIVSSLTAAIILVCVTGSAIVAKLAIDLNHQHHELNGMYEAVRESEAEALAANETANEALESAKQQRDEAKREAARALRSSYHSDLRRAYDAASEGHVLMASDILAGIEANIDRSFKPRCDFALLKARLSVGNRRFEPHLGPATEVEAIPGTNLIVSASHDGYLHFHNLDTGQLENATHVGYEIDALSVSADGKRLAVAHRDQAAEARFAKLHRLQIDRNSSLSWIGEAELVCVSPSTIESLEFSSCSGYLAVGPRYNPVTIWDLTGGIVRRVETDSRNAAIAFSPDGSQCVITRKDNCLQVVDVVSGEIVKDIACQGRPHCVRFSNDGQWIAFSYHNDEYAWLLPCERSDSQPLKLRQPRGVIETLAFSADSRSLAAGTLRGGIAVWHVPEASQAPRPGSSQSARRSSILHKGSVTDIHFVDDYLLSVSDSGSLISSQLGLESETPLGPNSTSVTVVNALQEESIFVGRADGSVVERRLATEAEVRITEPREAAVSKICVSQDGNLLGIGWDDGQLAVFELATGTLTSYPYNLPEGVIAEQIHDMAFSPDRRLLAACGADKHVRVWPTADPQAPAWDQEFNSAVFALSFVGNERIAVGGHFEEIHVLETANGTLHRRIEGTARTHCLLYDAFHDRLLSGHEDGRIRIYDADHFRIVGTLEGNEGSILSLSTTPCNACYLSGDSRGQLKVWTADDSKLVGTLRNLGKESQVHSLEFFPSTLNLLVHSTDGDARKVGSSIWTVK